jgi:hypothetical protein
VSQGSANVTCMGHLLGYARLSTTDQPPHLQVDAFERRLLPRFTESVTGARSDRPSSSRSWTSPDPSDAPPTCSIAAASSLVTR